MTTVGATDMFGKFDVPGVRVFVLDVRGTDPTSDLTLLSREERDRAARFARALDRAAFIAGRAAMRRMLADELGLAPARVAIVAGKHGRPRLAPELGSLVDFNVTHASTCVAGALARSGARVGIDVESTSAVRDLDILIQEVTGVRERTLLAHLQGVERVNAFLACWTRKEAIAKAVGTGVAYPLRNIDLPDEPIDGAISFQCCDVGMEMCRSWMIRTASSLSGEFVLSIAVHGHQTPFRATTLSLPSSHSVSGVGIAAVSADVQTVVACKFPPLRRTLMPKSSVSVLGRRYPAVSSSTGRAPTQAGQPISRASAAS